MGRQTLWASIRDEANALITRDPVFLAGGEFLANHFAAQERLRGVPEDGYGRRPPIGLRLAVDDRQALTCKPGWTPAKWDHTDQPPVLREPGRLHVGRVGLELVTPGIAVRITVTEDGAKLGRCAVYRDRARNAENVMHVARTLQRLLADPMGLFAEDRDRCCCCGKSLSDATSRLRGIGPECVRYFGQVEVVAKAVRDKYRRLDADTWAADELDRAAREEVRTIDLSEATRWVAGDGLSTWDYCRRVEQHEWVERIASAIGDDRVRAIQADVKAAHLADLAEEARRVVPGRVVDAWLATATADGPKDQRGRDEDEWPPSLHRAHTGPETAVLDGLRLLSRARVDRDLFDQLGLPESHWGGRG